jgi:hypothetical protein
MSCILITCIRYTYDKNLELIQPLLQECPSTFCVFGFGPLVAKQRIRSSQNLATEWR